MHYSSNTATATATKYPPYRYLKRHFDNLDRIAAFSALQFNSQSGDSDGSFQAIVERALAGARTSEGESAGDVPSKLRERWSDFVIINTALSVRAWEIWSSIWIAEHPDRANEWETGEDADLMSLWRETVCDMFTQHHMAEIRSMTASNYCAKLVVGGLENSIAVAVTEFFFDVTWEDGED